MTDAGLFLPGDIFFSRGRGLISEAIRFFSRGVGEARSSVNHVGIITTAGDPDHAIAVEALLTVVKHPLVDQYGGTADEVAVYRAINLSLEQKRVIVSAASDQTSIRYVRGLWPTLTRRSERTSVVRRAPLNPTTYGTS